MIEGPSQTFTCAFFFLLLSKNEGCDYGNYHLSPFNLSFPLSAVILNHDITVLRIWNCTLAPSLERQISLPSSNEQRSQRQYESWDFRLLPRCSWGLHSFGVSHNICCYLLLTLQDSASGTSWRVKISKRHMVHLVILTPEGGSDTLPWDPGTARNSI
jgi:hypothetical protein